jgi:hypothetical protein
VIPFPRRCSLQTGSNSRTITRHHCPHFPTLSLPMYICRIPESIP